MSFEIPFDLIHQLQTSLRKQANISSYNPDDTTLPNLPIASKSISELDPSPINLRCKFCSARLLRGEQSVICVFCGKQLPRQNEGDDDNEQLSPEPISFKSTLGCKWLLESLNLDGSETVERLSEALELSGESLLSDLLDLQIKWTDRPEEFDVRAKDDTLFQNSNSAGPVLDNYIIKEKDDSAFASKIEQLPPPNEGSDFQVRENLNLFEDVKPPEISGTFTQDENRDSFSAWDAEFQSAESKPVHGESKTGGEIVGPTVDLSAHMDSIFGSVKKKNDTALSSSDTNDWFHDDLWSVGNRTKQDTANSKSDGIMENTSNFSLEGVGRNQDNEINNKSDSHDAWGDFTAKLNLNTEKPPKEREIEFEDDSSDTWNDFTVLPSVIDSSNQEVTHVKIESKESDDRILNEDINHTTSSNDAPDHKTEIYDSFDNWNDFTSSTAANTESLEKQTANHANEAPESKITDQDVDSFDNWNDFTSSTVVNTETLEKQTANHANEAPESKITDQDVDSFDNWNDFTSSTVANTECLEKQTANHANEAQESKIIDQDVDSFDNWNDFTSSTVANSESLENQTANHANEGPESKVIVQDVDSFDVWNDFSSSTGAREAHSLANKTVSRLAPDPEISSREDDDPFGAWNDFTNSTSSQHPSNGSSNQTMDASFESAKVKDNLVKYSSDPKQFKVATSRESFDAWGDFTSSTAANDPSNGSEPSNNRGVDIKDDSSVLWNEFTTTNQEATQINSDRKTISVDSGLFDNWNDFRSTSGTQVPIKETVNHITSSSEDPDCKTTDEKYDPLGVWKFSTSSTGENNPSVLPIQTVNNETNKKNQDEDDFGDWNDFTSSVGEKNPSNGFPQQIVNHLTSGNKATPESKSKTTDQDDDSFDGWNDFMSSADAKDSSKISEKQNDNAWNAFTSSTEAKDPFEVGPAVNFATSSSGAPDSKAVDQEDDSFDNWNDFVSSPEVTVSQPSKISKQEHDWNNFTGLTSANDQSKISPAKPTVDKKYDEDTLDAWNDFISSPGVPEPYGSSKDTLTRLTASNNSQNSNNQDYDPFDAWNNLNSLTKAGNPSDSSSHQTVGRVGPSNETPDKITDQDDDDDDDDAFGDWNDFQSSTTAQDPFEILSKPSVFSGESNNQRSYEVNFVELKASVPNRTDEPRDGGANVDSVPKSEDTNTGSKPDDVDIFHDLSFMLQSNFYKPSKTGQ